MELLIIGVVLCAVLYFPVYRWLENSTRRTQNQMYERAKKSREEEKKQEAKYVPKEYSEPQPITGNHYDTDYLSVAKRCRHNVDKQPCAFCTLRREVVTSKNGKTVYRYYPSNCERDLWAVIAEDE